MRFIATFLVAAVVASFSATALAETFAVDAGCRWTKPTVGTEVPANVAGFVFDEGDAYSVTSASITDASGAVVPSHLVGGEDAGVRFDQRMLMLDAPLVSGTTYRLQWSDGCASDKSVSFTATASAPMPTAAGTIRFGELKHTYCGDGRAGFQIAREVLFDEDPTLTPFLSVSVIELLIDGKEPINPWGYYSQFATPQGEVRVGCTLNGVDTPRVSLRVRVPGGPTFTTPEATAELSCASPPAGCIEATDSGTSPDAGETKMSSDSSSGCSASGAGGAAWAILIPALVIGAAARRRKR